MRPFYRMDLLPVKVALSALLGVVAAPLKLPLPEESWGHVGCEERQFGLGNRCFGRSDSIGSGKGCLCRNMCSKRCCCCCPVCIQYFLVAHPPSAG